MSVGSLSYKQTTNKQSDQASTYIPRTGSTLRLGHRLQDRSGFAMDLAKLPTYLTTFPERRAKTAPSHSFQVAVKDTKKPTTNYQTSTLGYNKPTDTVSYIIKI